MHPELPQHWHVQHFLCLKELPVLSYVCTQKGVCTLEWGSQKSINWGEGCFNSPLGNADKSSQLSKAGGFLSTIQEYLFVWNKVIETRPHRTSHRFLLLDFISKYCWFYSSLYKRSTTWKRDLPFSHLSCLPCLVSFRDK